MGREQTAKRNSCGQHSPGRHVAKVGEIGGGGETEEGVGKSRGGKKGKENRRKEGFTTARCEQMQGRNPSRSQIGGKKKDAGAGVEPVVSRVDQGGWG